MSFNRPWIPVFVHRFADGGPVLCRRSLRPPTVISVEAIHEKAPRERGFPEPISGLEPLTYALRMRCSTS